MITKLLSLIGVLTAVLFAVILIALTVCIIYAIVHVTADTIREMSNKHKDDNKNT